MPKDVKIVNKYDLNEGFKLNVIHRLKLRFTIRFGSLGEGGGLSILESYS
jgi:hypothetical protein